MAINGAAIAKINRDITGDIKKELRLQGHYLTGELEQSIQERERLTENDTVLEAYAYAYLQELEYGVDKEDIPALDTNSSEFKNLTKWVRLRGLEHSGAQYTPASTIAEAIWRKWQKQGKPLETSKQFSKTGEILFAVETVFNKKDSTYFGAIDEEAVLTIDKSFFHD